MYTASAVLVSELHVTESDVDLNFCLKKIPIPGHQVAASEANAICLKNLDNDICRRTKPY